MIKVTRLDGSEMHINEELIELIEETPDTHIMLTNGNRYLVRESAMMLIEKIISFRSRILARSHRGEGKKYLLRKQVGRYRAVRQFGSETD